jgi:hypothetical protein
MSNDFSMNAGDSKLIYFPILDRTGAPVDINSAIITWKLSKSNVGTGKTALASRSSDDLTILLTNPSYNGCTIVLELENTNTLNGRYYHEVRVVIDGVEETYWGYATIHGTTTCGS